MASCGVCAVSMQSATPRNARDDARNTTASSSTTSTRRPLGNRELGSLVEAGAGSLLESFSVTAPPKCSDATRSCASEQVERYSDGGSAGCSGTASQVMEWRLLGATPTRHPVHTAMSRCAATWIRHRWGAGTREGPGRQGSPHYRLAKPLNGRREMEACSTAAEGPLLWCVR